MRCVYSKDEKERIIVDRRIKICINCGNENLLSEEFGFSCENCGILMYLK